MGAMDSSSMKSTVRGYWIKKTAIDIDKIKPDMENVLVENLKRKTLTKVKRRAGITRTTPAIRIGKPSICP
jgi:hypothetical protein